MENEKWQCECGQQNTGQFCSKCGKSRESTDEKQGAEHSEEYLRLQIRQQELMQVQEQRRIAAEKEQRHKEYEAKMKVYNEQRKQIPITEVKRTASSWIVLTLCILSSVAVACSLVSVITKISNSWFSLIISLIKLLLISLVCGGFWRSYIAGKSKQMQLNSGGPRMLRGVLRFYQFIAYFIIIAIIALAIILIISTKACADDISNGTSNSNSDLAGAVDTASTVISSSIIGVLIGIVVALAVVLIILIVYFHSAISFAGDVVNSFDTHNGTPYTSSRLAIMFFLIGGVTLLLAIGQLAATSLLNDFFNELGSVGKFLSSAKLTKLDVGNLIAQIVKSGMYIFGGIFVFDYNKLDLTIRKKLSAIQKPEE